MAVVLPIGWRGGGFWHQTERENVRSSLFIIKVWANLAYSQQAYIVRLEKELIKATDENGLKLLYFYRATSSSVCQGLYKGMTQSPSLVRKTSCSLHKLPVLWGDRYTSKIESLSSAVRDKLWGQIPITGSQGPQEKSIPFPHLALSLIKVLHYILTYWISKCGIRKSFTKRLIAKEVMEAT